MTEKDPNWDLAAGVGDKSIAGRVRGYRRPFGRYGPSKVVRPPVEEGGTRYENLVKNHPRDLRGCIDAGLPCCEHCGSLILSGECGRKCIGYWLRRFSS